MNSEKLTILVDMDSIVADLQGSWYAAYNEEYNDNLSMDDIHSWDTHKYVKPECGKDIYKYFTPEMFSSLKPIRGAQKALKRLVHAGHTVLFLTHSPYGCRDAKEAWAKEHFPFVTELGCMKSKFLVNSDVFIDDSPANIKLYRQHHPNANIFSIAYPYNKEVEGLLDLRLGSWRNPEEAWNGFVEAIEEISFNRSTTCSLEELSHITG